MLGRGTVLTPAFLETTLAIAHPSLDRPVADAYRAPYRGAARRGGIGGFVADIPVDRTHPSAAELDRIAAGVAALEVPALVMWGPRDPVFLERYLDDLADRLPHADVHRFEGAGHLLPDDADVAGTVLDWLGDRLPEGHAPGGGETGLQTGTHDAPESRGARPFSGAAARDTSSSPSLGSDHVPTGPTTAATDHRPLWAALDDLADDASPALVEMAAAGGPRTVSWRLLARRVREVAAGLADLGVRPGDRVSLLVTPGADLTAVLYACVRIGAVVVVADAGLGLKGLTRAVRGARPDWVIGALPGLGAARALGWPGRRIATVALPAPARAVLGVEHTLVEVARRGARRLAAGAALPAAPSPDAPAAVLFTSGSTGPAKGVVYTHGQLAAVRDVLAAQYGVGVGTGLVAGFAPFALLGPALGARSVAPDMDVTAPRTLTARAVADAVAAADATVVFLSPAALANVVATASALTAADRESLARVRLFLSAGAPVSAALLASATDLMPNAAAHTPYGMTEGLLMTDTDLDGVRSAASAPDDGICVGTPAAGVRVRIAPLDDAGAPTGEPTEQSGVTGEVVVAAPHVRDHYDRLWRTDRVSRLGVDDPRGHRTGDVGHLDVDGRLWIEGRLQHVVTTADGVVTPVGPEQRIERVDGVGRAGVAGTGPAGTQQVVAVVETVPRHGVRGSRRRTSPPPSVRPPGSRSPRCSSSPSCRRTSGTTRRSIAHGSRGGRRRCSAVAGWSAREGPGHRGERLPRPGDRRRRARRRARRPDVPAPAVRGRRGRGRPRHDDGHRCRRARGRRRGGRGAPGSEGVARRGPGRLRPRQRRRDERAARRRPGRRCGALRLRVVAVRRAHRVLAGRCAADPAEPTAARGHYARTKAAAELLALAADEPGFAVVAVRPHLVWGPGDTQLVGRIVDRARTGRLPLLDSGAALIDTLYVDNAASAMVAALEHAADDAVHGNAYVVTNGEPRPVGELLAGICTASGVPAPRMHVPAALARAAGSVVEAVWRVRPGTDEPPMTRFLAEQLSTAHWFDQRRTRQDLHWAPTVSIDEGLARLAVAAR